MSINVYCGLIKSQKSRVGSKTMVNYFEWAENEIRKERNFEEMPKEHLFTAVFLKYVLWDGDWSAIRFHAAFTDGARDGGIDAVVDYDVDNVQRIAIIQSKRVEQIDRNDIIDAANKIHRTLVDLENGKTSKYSERLRHVLATKKSLTDSGPIDIYICTSAKVSYELKDSVDEGFKIDSNLKDYSIEVLFRENIEVYIKNVEDPKRFVKEGVIKRKENSGTVNYKYSGEEEKKGIIVSVSAQSLNELYERFKDQGLFAQNLRNFFVNKRVDDGISQTIKHSPEDFWLNNNGITISCKDFFESGTKIKLWDFSVINGCQTLTQLGKNSIPRDFEVCCKIIKEDNEDKMASFAEAANSQKPIQPRDLKSNAMEQRELKISFDRNEPKVHFLIKRGERKITKARLERRGMRLWQQIDNKAYGQLVLSFYRQKPYIALSRPGKIFDSPDTYKEVFHRKHRDIKTDVDLLRLNDVYNRWRDKNINVDHMLKESDEDILYYGRFSILASVGLLVKLKRGMLDLTKLRNAEIRTREIVKESITGGLFPSNGLDLEDETEDGLNSLFNVLWSINSDLMEATDNVTNKYKTEDFYNEKLVPKLIEKWIREPFSREFQKYTGFIL